MDKYNFKSIEKKWQKIWEEKQPYKAVTGLKKPKFYPLVEFPYPSGQGLHVGHPRSYTALDVIARKKRLEGYNVLYTIGWDAFGLPTENYAIKNKIHPKIVTEKNINNFKRQLKSLGISFDWSREINTTDPSYYKWTQWIFLKLYENNLAYKAKMPVNWCPSCKVGLANEEVVDGKCERCGKEVVIKEKSQWMLKITDYADKLLEGLDEVDFIDRVKTQQKNWIGKSSGYEVDFDFMDSVLTVYTTRVDTIFGATYIVMSPENPIIDEIKDNIENFEDVIKYREITSKKTDFQRSELNKDKTGVRLDGVNAINPLNGAKMPVFISDYVLMSYGTGVVMGVPAHDTRDHEFAVKYDLPIVEVVKGGEDVQKEAYTDVEDGVIVNSGEYTGLKVTDAIEKIGDFLVSKNKARKKTNYKLRDWVFSRQRYWGEPIPLVYCDKCGWVPVPESNLPVTLPETENYAPSDNGESPLANIKDWVNTTCPKCRGKATRETDTMPQWAGSSWYFLRYTDPNNDECLASKEALEYWMPVDWYNGGMEHTTLHLLYSRFWHKFLYDIGVVNTSEPYEKRTSHGMILGEDGQKMSKSRGNVVNPDEILDVWGADTFRLYEMFMGDFEKMALWSSQNIKGCYRFIERLWNMQELVTCEKSDLSIVKLLHKTIQKVGSDYDALKANTAIAQMMTFVNKIYEIGSINKEDYKTLLILANPVIPHVTSEIWEIIDVNSRIDDQKWPQYDEKYLLDEMMEIPIQINGKMKGKIEAGVDISKEDILEIAKNEESIREAISGKNIIKVIYVPKKILNIVVK